MRFDEAPLTADPERIHRVLQQEIPTRCAAYVLPMLVGFLISLFAVAGLSLALAFLATQASGANFEAGRIPWILAGGYLASLLVGRFAPRPDYRDSGSRWGKTDSNVSGCLGALYHLFAGNLYDTLAFVFGRSHLESRDLDLGTTLVTACLQHPGTERPRIVRAVVKARPEFSSSQVEKVLDQLLKRGIIRGGDLLRVPPSRVRDFGAMDAY